MLSLSQKRQDNVEQIAAGISTLDFNRKLQEMATSITANILEFYQALSDIEKNFNDRMKSLSQKEKQAEQVFGDTVKQINESKFVKPKDDC